MSKPSPSSPVEFFTGKTGYLKRWWTPPPPVSAVRVSGSLPCLAAREANDSAPPLRGSTSSAKKPASLPVATPIFASSQISHHLRTFASSVEASCTPFFVRGCLPALAHTNRLHRCLPLPLQVFL